MRKEFQSDSPELVLLISDSKTPSDTEKIFQKGFDQSDGIYQLLPLFIEKKDLGKMLTALKLMDVRGAYFTGKSSGHLPKGADAVTLKKNHFEPVSVLNETYRSYFKGYLELIRSKRIVIWGPTLLTKNILPHIKACDPTSLNTLSFKSSPTNLTGDETHILCGKPDTREVQKLMATIPSGSSILDLRTEIVDYRSTTHKKIFKNNEFLASWVKTALSFWGYQDIDQEKLTRSISRLRVK